VYRSWLTLAVILRAHGHRHLFPHRRHPERSAQRGVEGSIQRQRWPQKRL